MSTGTTSPRRNGFAHQAGRHGFEGTRSSGVECPQGEVLPSGGDAVAAVSVGPLEGDVSAPAPFLDPHDEVHVVGVVQFDVQPQRHGPGEFGVFCDGSAEPGACPADVEAERSWSGRRVGGKAAAREVPGDPPGAPQRPGLLVPYLYDVVATVADLQPDTGQGWYVPPLEVMLEEAQLGHTGLLVVEDGPLATAVGVQMSLRAVDPLEPGATACRTGLRPRDRCSSDPLLYPESTM